MFWLFLAILAVGYFLFKAKEERAKRPQDQHSQQQRDVINSGRATPANDRKRTSAAGRSTSSKRPYIKCYLDELKGIASSEWDSVEVLKDVHHELGFRSRKKANVLRSRLAERLSELGSD